MQTAIRKSKQIISKLPYKRSRIFLNKIYRNEAIAEQLGKHMCLVNGVQFSNANPLTGKILVIFDEAIISEYQIYNSIYTFFKNPPEKREAKVIQLDSFQKRREKKTSTLSNSFNINQYAKYSTDRPPYHIMSKNEIEELFNTDIAKGLSKKQAHELIKKYGCNVLSEKKRDSILKKIIKNMFDFSSGLLIGVGTISFILQQIPDALAIFGIVILQTILSTLQQHKAENSLSSLKGMLESKARVIRDGREHTIDSKYLVPGDVILVEGGDKIPADARVIECCELRTTEASLTGESTAVDKNISLCQRDIDLSNQYNMLFMGTDVLCGRAKAIVTSTGMNTEIGKIAVMLQSIQGDMPPIQKKVTRLTRIITIAASSFCFTFIGAGLLAGRSLGEVLIISICLSIGAIPESLPVVVSASMALSVQRMAKKNAIVRNLSAVETLGSTDVICCDKTGTLTMNEMTVKRIYVDRSFYNVSGFGYSPDGEIIPENKSKSADASLDHLLKASILCNNAGLSKIEGKWTVQGDPTEGALLTAAYKKGLPVDEIKKGLQRIKEIPFDSCKQCMITFNEGEEGLVAYCKGAYSKVSEKCNYIYLNGKEKLFTKAEKENIQEICDQMGNDALRVLAFAYKSVSNDLNSSDSNFVFLGIVGMADPARPEVKASIDQCHHAGIKVVMITGDNKNTATEIARQVGLLTDGIVVTGSELDNMSEDELQAHIEKVQVFARTRPEHKYRIVKALKKAGHIVAMIGDGVNDAPAMKEADIGVAMGKGGSDVAKDVAEITLVDDNFSTIVAAIQEGRSVTNSIQNAVRYLLSGAFGEIAAIGLCTLGFGVLPLLSIQILWINVIAETIIGSALTSEPPCCDVMDKAPNAKDSALIELPLMKQILKGGLLIGLSTLGIFSGAMLLGLGLAKARTLAFSTLIISQLNYAYQCRSNPDQKPGKYMQVAMFSSSALLFGIIYLPTLGSFFGTVPLNTANAGAAYLTSNICRLGTVHNPRILAETNV